MVLSYHLDVIENRSQRILYLNDTISDNRLLKTKMSGNVPDLERLYECGDVLANAKGLSYKAVNLHRV